MTARLHGWTEVPPEDVEETLARVLAKFSAERPHVAVTVMAPMRVVAARTDKQETR